jgi:hypothetical protein
MTEQETIGGMSTLAWLWAEFAVGVLALGVARPLWPACNRRRPAARLTGGGGAESDLRCARGARIARVDWRCRVDLGGQRT